MNFNKFISNNKIIMKLIFISMIYIIKNIYKNINIINIFQLNNNYLKIQNNIKINFNNSIHNKIRIGIYAYTIKNGGRARLTSLLINYFYHIKIFNLFLLTKKNRQNNEYIISKKIKRITIKKELIYYISKYKINILIYQLDYINEIKKINKQKNKVIFYIHSSSFDWIYSNYTIFKSIYNEYINCKYIISLVPFENDYLFKKWKISSILMNNFITFNYSSIIPSDLSTKNILMLGRGNDKKKRFNIGVQSMEYIIKEINECELKIISNLTGIDNLRILVNNLNLKNNIKFVGYSSTPEIFFKNVSLNLFPSITIIFKFFYIILLELAFNFKKISFKY